METPTNTTPSEAYLLCSASYPGISDTQPAHHEAQKSTTRIFPLNSRELTALPPKSFSVHDGAGAGVAFCGRGSADDLDGAPSTLFAGISRPFWNRTRPVTCPSASDLNSNAA